MTGEDMRTNIKNIFAIGDVRGEILLAYTATHDGTVAVDNALGKKAKVNYLGCPRYLHSSRGRFSRPEGEEAAEKHELAIGKFPLARSGRRMPRVRLPVK